MSYKALGLCAFLFVIAGPALALPAVDGSITGDGYGAAVSVQAVQTGFGDNLSELDAAYCTEDGGRLYLALTGNIENNFNKIEIFLDTRAGGENVLSGLPGNDGANAMTGMTFDAGFSPDFHIIVRRGNSGGDRLDLDFAELGTPNFSFYGDVFGGTQEGSGATGTGLNTQVIEVGYDDSNLAGIIGGTGAANQAAAMAVQTGLELSIALTDLGFTSGDIGICAFVNNANHNFASNQFLGSLASPQGNLGGDGTGTFTGFINFDLGSFTGDQYFVCTPSSVPVRPTSWSRLKQIYN